MFETEHQWVRATYWDEEENYNNEDEEEGMALTTIGHVAGSCASSAISGLSHCKDAEDAIRQFCIAQLVVAKTGFNKTATTFKKIYSHYIFLAGPEIAGKGWSSPSGWYKYGTEFADYIVKNGLGKVATLPPVVNEMFHPDTTCQVWLWQPDAEALKKWWTKRYPE